MVYKGYAVKKKKKYLNSISRGNLVLTPFWNFLHLKHCMFVLLEDRNENNFKYSFIIPPSVILGICIKIQLW